jgi:oxygen-independent coproporphyrinogen-3 oxidase
MLEPHTILYNQNIRPIDEEIDALMYDTIINTLGYYGYEHYEISNFSKPKFESRHNLTYWDNKEYYGLGLGASGYINNIRYDNTKTLNEYLKGNYVNESIKIDFNTNIENAFILGLRKMKGIKKKDLIIDTI